MSFAYPSDNNDEEFQDFASLLDDYYEFSRPERGDIRDAIILSIDKYEILVDLGVKRDGIVPSQDIERIPPHILKNLKPGQNVPVYIMNPMDEDGNLIVSINMGLQEEDWKRSADLLESGETVEACATGYNKGGLLVKFGRLEGFIPNTHLTAISQGLDDKQRRQALDNLIDTALELKVIEVDPKRRRLIFSQREVQRDWRAQQKERLLDELTTGDIVDGVVTGIREFGVFVNVGGADGLIHVSELAWHRVPHPNDILDIGDELRVYVLDLDHDQQRIALSLKRTVSDPWKTVDTVYSIGDIVQGKVSNVVDFGVFVVLPDGIEGLLHLTEMLDGNLTEPYSHVRRGDILTMEVVAIEKDRKRIGFSQKSLNLSLVTGLPQDEQTLEGVQTPPEEGFISPEADLDTVK